MSIRVVFWDLGGVLLRTHDWGGRKQWELRLGLAPGELERRVFDGPTAQRAALGQADESHIWSDLAQSFGLTDGERDRLAADFFAGDRVDYDLVAYIRSLRPRRKTGVISNAWPEIRGLLEHEWHIADAFDALVISAETGLAKPDPAIYRLALDRVQAEPSQAVFVDDFEANLESARALGMQTVLFRAPGQARADVERILNAGAAASIE